MTPGLRNTILISASIAALLNLGQTVLKYNTDARAAFAPGWTTSSATPAPKTVSKTTPAAAPAAATVVSTDPNAGSVAAAASKLFAAGLRADYAANYLEVERQTGTPWELVAAVHYIETHQSGDTTITSYAGAQGPMQFMPATFAHYGSDGDGDGTKNIHDLDDALLSGGRYLAATGATKGQYQNALYRYNHSYAYVNQVLAIARKLGL